MDAVVIAAMVSQTFPHDTPAGPVVFKLLDTTGATVAAQSVTAGATDLSASASFTSVAPGTYTVSAERQDGNSKALAPPMLSAPFTVADTSTVNISVPASVSVTPQASVVTSGAPTS